MPEWQLGALAGGGDGPLAEAVAARFRAIGAACFSGEPTTNPSLGVEVRALRRSDGWCVFLLLTPWMLSRVFLPERAPALPLPEGWRAGERANAAYLVIGPAVEFELFGGRQRAHINFDPVIGHYLIQPLVQAMGGFAVADEAFAAWNEVLSKRSRFMADQQRDCPWQRELSRREFMVGLGGNHP